MKIIRRINVLTIGLYLWGISSPAMAAPYCPPRIIAKEEPFLEKAPPIPKKFRSLMKAGKTDLAVATESGKTLCIKLGWTADINNFWISSNKRFVGFDVSGFEHHGHITIDRYGAGREIATGQRPVFSPDNKHFAFAQLSDSGWGNFEGAAIWSVDASGSTMASSYVNDEIQLMLPYGINWKIDRWIDNETVTLSMVHEDDIIPGDDYDKNVARSPRRAYHLKHLKQKWQLRDCLFSGQC
jgi:hypothetical protein